MHTSIDDWRAEGRFVRLLGYEIFFVDSGGDQKPAIFLIHGFPTASWDWTRIWGNLRASHRLVALDMLGFGFSDKPSPHTYSIMEQADLCEALVAECALSEFHVLAHDYGDTVAQELLARQNEGRGEGRWASVCFLNGGLFPETHRTLLIQRLLLSPLGPSLSKLTSRRSFERSFSAVFGSGTKPTVADLDAFWGLVSYKAGKRAVHGLMSYMTDRKRHRERWVGALQNASVPIGLINGSVDPVSGAHMVERFRELVGDDHFIVELPEIGHYPQFEAPDRVVDAYRSFLADL